MIILTAILLFLISAEAKGNVSHMKVKDIQPKTEFSH